MKSVYNKKWFIIGFLILFSYCMFFMSCDVEDDNCWVCSPIGSGRCGAYNGRGFTASEPECRQCNSTGRCLNCQRTGRINRNRTIIL